MTVFVSHSSEDRDAVDALTRIMRAGGFTVWMDVTDLDGGQEWWSAILTQIRDCDVFVFAISAHSLNSDPCRAEVDYATALGRPVLPVEIGDVPQEERRNYAVYSEQLIDYRTPSPEGAIALMRALTELTALNPPLPDPLPAPPPIPYEYLKQLGSVIRGSGEISPAEQQLFLTQLRVALREERDESVRASVRSLLRDLGRRRGVLHTVAIEVDEILGTAASSGSTQNSAGSTQKSDTTGAAQQSASAAGTPSTGSSAGASAAAPGWYADPSGDGQTLRYWDGQHWTQHVHARGTATATAGTSSVPQPARTMTSPTPTGQTSRIWSTLAFVFGGISVLPFLSWITWLLAVAFAIVAMVQKDRRGVAALIVAIVGTIIGWSWSLSIMSQG